MSTVIALRKRKTRAQVDTTGRAVRTHTRRFRVKSDVQLDTYEVLDELGIAAYDPHDFDAGSFVRAVDIEEEETRRVPNGDASTAFTYVATVEYSSEMPAPKDDNPLNEPPEAEWSGVESTEATYTDRDGQAVLNTAGDYFFDPTLETTLVNPVLTISRNEVDFSAPFVFDFAGKINSADFYGAAAKHLRMKTPRAKRKWHDGQPYWNVTYEFEYKRGGWQPKVLNQGLREKVALGPGITKRPIRDETTRQPVRDPVPLDEDGAAIPSEDLPGAAYFLEPDILLEKDFNDLGL